MSEPRAERCEACRFWHDAAGEGIEGECRRLAPRHILREIEWNDNRSGNMDAAIWPETFDDDWCGEWQAKTETHP